MENPQIYHPGLSEGLEDTLHVMSRDHKRYLRAHTTEKRREAERREESYVPESKFAFSAKVLKNEINYKHKKKNLKLLLRRFNLL